MKKILRVLIVLSLLVILSPVFGASQRTVAFSSSSQGLPLGRVSPLSGGALVALDLRSGLLRWPSQSTPESGVAPNLNCKPAPCALPNVQASEGGQPVNEDPIAVDSNNTKHLLTGGNDYNCRASLQGFYTSSDGGKKWSHTCMSTISGCSGAGDPGVGYNLTGAAYITGIDICSNGWHIIFEKSTNNGLTWSSPAIAVNPIFSGGLTDKDWLQIDDSPTSPFANSLYISVTQFDSSSNSEISVTYSHNNGATWTTVGVDTKQIYPNVDQFSDLAVAKDGTVYVSWMRCTANGPAGDCGGTTASLMVSKSTDGGKTWSSPVTIAKVNLAPDACSCAFYGSLPNTSERVSEIPAIDVDRSSGTFAGNVYVVMYNWTGSFMQVEVSTSTDGGNTWSIPVHVAPKSDNHDQFFPWLTVSPTGIVGVTWLDRRNDPSNINYEAFATVSKNGGAGFKADVQIASTASDPFHDGFNGGFMGDYTGNYWATGKVLMASWMDTRNNVNCQDEVGGYKV